MAFPPKPRICPVQVLKSSWQKFSLSVFRQGPSEKSLSIHLLCSARISVCAAPDVRVPLCLLNTQPQTLLCPLSRVARLRSCRTAPDRNALKAKEQKSAEYLQHPLKCPRSAGILQQIISCAGLTVSRRSGRCPDHS